MKTIAIVPALNEELSIERVIVGLKKAGADRIVVIDGNSTDKTVEKARKAGAVVMMQEGKGKGMAFQTFLRKEKIEDDAFYVMLDGDASYLPREMHLMTDGLEEGNDVMMGKRAVLVHNFKSFFHWLGAAGISLVATVLFFKRVPDVCTGYWGFRGKVLKKLNITAKRFDLEANLFAQACKKGFRVKSVPISYEKRLGEAKLHVSDAFDIVLHLFRQRFVY
ncbi:MAG: glycosyltransferase family 2 protein [Candidatus Micrarchaeota archaeon]